MAPLGLWVPLRVLSVSSYLLKNFLCLSLSELDKKNPGQEAGVCSAPGHTDAPTVLALPLLLLATKQGPRMQAALCALPHPLPPLLPGTARGEGEEQACVHSVHLRCACP